MVEETKVVDKKPAKTADPWDKTVKIKLPKAPQGEDNFIIASLNGRTFKIMKGIEVDVPVPIAEIIEGNFREADKADEYLDALVNGRK